MASMARRAWRKGQRPRCTLETGYSFTHSGEVDFHQLGLEPYRLPVERYGLPNIDHLSEEPRQGGEIPG